MSDYIDRQAAIDALKEHSYYVRYDYLYSSIEKGMTVTGMEQALNEIPSADVEPVRHGRWKYRKADGGFHTDCVCSECKAKFAIGWKYCPNCGAKMERRRG